MGTAARRNLGPFQSRGQGDELPLDCTGHGAAGVGPGVVRRKRGARVDSAHGAGVAVGVLNVDEPRGLGGGNLLVLLGRPVAEAPNPVLVTLFDLVGGGPRVPRLDDETERDVGERRRFAIPAERRVFHPVEELGDVDAVHADVLEAAVVQSADTLESVGDPDALHAEVARVVGAEAKQLGNLLAVADQADVQVLVSATAVRLLCPGHHVAERAARELPGKFQDGGRVPIHPLLLLFCEQGRLSG